MTLLSIVAKARLDSPEPSGRLCCVSRESPRHVDQPLKACIAKGFGGPTQPVVVPLPDDGPAARLIRSLHQSLSM
jgi:hypothetical protein